MALFDFLKRKKENEKAKKTAKSSDTPKTEKTETNSIVKTTGLNKKAENFSYTIIKEPHISEKATDLAEQNKYTFKVFTNSNKPEIKKSVEGIYGVNVLDVRIITVPHKKRRLGKTEGFKKGFKKAVVTLKEGQKIEVF